MFDDEKIVYNHYIPCDVIYSLNIIDFTDENASINIKWRTLVAPNISQGIKNYGPKFNPLVVQA